MSDTFGNIIIGSILFTVIVSGIFISFDDMTETYGVERTDNQTALFNLIDNMTVKTEEMTAKIENTSTTDTDSITEMAQGGFQVLRIGLGMVSLTNTLIRASAAEIGVPPFIVTAAIAIILFMAVYAIVRLVLGAI